VTGAPTQAQAPNRAYYGQPARSAWNMAWLGNLADAVEISVQRLTSALAEAVGYQKALLLMLPVGLLLRPLLALMRSVPQAPLLRIVCVLIVAIGIAAGPWVGTRAGLVLLPIYVLGWTCALSDLRRMEAAELARKRLVRAGRLARKTLTVFRAELTPDRRN
jgi:hypothetical protein